MFLIDMKAMELTGIHQIFIVEGPDPVIIQPTDVLIRIKTRNFTVQRNY
jgi:hypothetical protein